MAADFLDAALIFDPETRTADAELGEDGDLLLDDTALTPMLISLGTDRRARPDDALPADRLYDLVISDIDCDIRRLKPAHTEVVFDYGSP